MGDEAGQQRVGGDVEGHAQPQVARPLVHLAGQLPLRHVELRRKVRRKLVLPWLCRLALRCGQCMTADDIWGRRQEADLQARSGKCLAYLAEHVAGR